MSKELEEDESAARRKRRRSHSVKKLPTNSKVEVRSLDDGFQGSWHPGTVVSCKHFRRVVKYDHSLADDGSGNLVDAVPVSPVIDGGSCNPRRFNYRGRIHPLPPDVPFGPSDLVYGLCMDVFYQESWWEGVVFDTNDGADKRLVFFPDLGDDMVVEISNMRVSQDWIEDADTWQTRGIWFFLKLIDDYRKNCPLPVSVKQIWYDLREAKGFAKIKEWTAGGNGNSLWKDLVLETITENLAFALSNQLFEVDLVKQELSVVEVINEASDSGEEDMDKSQSSSKRIVGASPIENVDDNAYCPQAVFDYCRLKGKKSYQGAAIKAVRLRTKQQLAADGWEFLYQPRQGKGEVIYISPRKKKYYSLRRASQAWIDEHGNEDNKEACTNHSGEEESLSKESYVRIEELSVVEVINEAADSGEEDMDKSQSSSKRIFVASPIENVDDDASRVEPSYCPQAVFDYCKLNVNKISGTEGAAVKALRLRTKQQLAADGWEFLYQPRRGKCEVIYISPWRKKYKSLRKACQAWIDVQGNEDNKEDCMDHPEEEESVSKESYVRIGYMGIQKGAIPLDIVQADHDDLLLLSKSKKVTSAELKLPARLLLSAKRVKKIVPGPFQQNPRNVISWLIENNAVLPREKVYCRVDPDNNVAEGRVNRDGIKCSCCSKVFTLRGFNLHVGSTSSMLSSSIFLEDGRSLLKCQVELLRGGENVMKDPDCNRNLRDNDNVCSVCHFGGDLILCGMCPSSFHISCLGLEGTPDGAWFCRSCCCHFCGKSGLKTEIDHPSDLNVLKCSQCQRKYHVGCLRERGEVDLENLSNGNWYCGTKCKKISAGLSELLGKPINVGDNLTWTLLKFVDPNNYSEDTPAFESSVESYVWLRIALDVLHECFEPVKEHYTKRDLIKDVIFSRGSELNRLDFQGFYTVILKKSDELVTVATVRIHGDKVAEMPLVGTRFMFRRLGMYRILVNKLEKILKDLGVERLVLPAVPSVMNTWTTSFGFIKMTETERLQFLDYTFLDFQDTVTCQKHLLGIPPSLELTSHREIIDLCHVRACSTKRDTNLVDASTISGELQATAMETSETVNQGLVGNDADMDENGRGEGREALQCYQRRRSLPERSQVQSQWTTIKIGSGSFLT